MESLRGNLLIASPRIADPNFARSVVLIAEHGHEGALGLVLNRPADTGLGAVGELDWLPAEDDDQIWIGGPVSADGVIVVAEFDEPDRAAVVIAGDLGLVPAEAEDRDALAASLRRTRAFAGHAGWSPGQLEDELEEDSWIVEPARADDVFTTDAGGLWAATLRRKGSDYALLATMPRDPSLN